MRGAGWEAFKGLALDVLTSESSRCLWRQAGVVERSLGQPGVQIQVGAGEPEILRSHWNTDGI